MPHSSTPHTKLSGLYAITDATQLSESLYHPRTFEKDILQAIEAGVKIFQYREKSNNKNKRLQQAQLLATICAKNQAICLINDDVQLAKTVNADGVHLGQDDMSILQAREILGRHALIGISCYHDLTRAKIAQQQNANYVAFGAIFNSPSKPEAKTTGLKIIKQAKQQLKLPVCAIGGINQSNIQQVYQQGADMIAVISALFATKNIKQNALNLGQSFNQH